MAGIELDRAPWSGGGPIGTNAEAVAAEATTHKAMAMTRIVWVVRPCPCVRLAVACHLLAAVSYVRPTVSCMHIAFQGSSSTIRLFAAFRRRGHAR